jgi:hypothetical protein
LGAAGNVAKDFVAPQLKAELSQVGRLSLLANHRGKREGSFNPLKKTFVKKIGKSPHLGVRLGLDEEVLGNARELATSFCGREESERGEGKK